MASVAALQFGQQLVAGLAQVAAVAPPGAIISPISVWFALVLLFNGAGPGTKTQTELWKAIGPDSTGFTASAAADFNKQASTLQKRLNAQQGQGLTLVIANAVWTKDLQVQKSYADDMKMQFNAEVQSVSSVAPINAWAEKVTNGMIKQVVPPGLPFNMIITNAVYFKGLWEYAFDKTSTRKQNFNAVTSSGERKVVQVDMMSRSFKTRDLQGTQTIRYADMEGQYRAVRMPYKGSTGLVAIFVLPDKSFKSINDAAVKITGEAVLSKKNWVSLFDISTLSVSLPRFKVSVSQLDLTKTLQSPTIGITAAFDAKVADFSKISDTPLFVTKVMQSAVVQVDESGTEAAAVTSVVMVTTSFRPDSTPPLVFDRPFLFFLVDETTQTVLFQGPVTDPSKSG